MKRIFKIFTTAALACSAVSVFAQEVDSACIKYQAIYQQRYKNENAANKFTDVTINNWRSLFFACPTASKNMYVPHGTNMMRYLYNNEKDQVKKQQYLDTLMMIYDRRIEYLGEESNYIGKKGAELYFLNPLQYEQAYEYCRKSVDAMGKNAEPRVMYACLKTAVLKFQKGTMEKGEVISLYQTIRGIMDANIAKGGKAAETTAKFSTEVDNLFIEIKPDCSDLVALFEPQFNANPQDTALLVKITDNLAKDCASSDLYVKAAVELDKLQPSAQSKRKLGDMYAEKKQTSLAMSYYKEAAGLEQDDTKKAIIYYNMARLTSGATAVSYAKQALGFNPNYGAAYLVIASKYAESASSCSAGAEFPDLEKWKVYWLAYDMCQKAKSVDSSVAGTANSYAASYKSHFPDTETLFGYNVTEGSSQTVGCWINATTTAKVK